MPLARLHAQFLGSWDLHDPQRRIAALVRDIGDSLSIMRPARRRHIEFAVAQRKWITTLARHDPQLIPLAAEVGAVDDLATIGRPVGPRFPCRFLVPQLAQRRTGPRVHAPEPAGAVNVTAV